MEIKNKRISIVGFGKSGRSLLEILLAGGAEIFISDAGSRDKFEHLLSDLDMSHVECEFGENTAKLYENKDLIILSPGVSIYNPIIQEALEAGVEVIGEIELAYRFSKIPVTAVTGTNGKSTTVSLIHKILCDHGVAAVLAGNIGIPLSHEAVVHPDASCLIAEVSSFQLETVIDFRPKIAVITNITSDHTDRHHGFDNYVMAKSRIFMNQTSDDFAVLNYDDPSCRMMSKNINSKILWFSISSSVKDGFFIKNGIVFKADSGNFSECFDIEETNLSGSHNVQNLLAALCVLSIYKIPIKEIPESVRHFEFLHHRIEFAGFVDNVKFYDDSKGTNPGAVIAAIDSFDETVALIAGGKDKGLDFSNMTDCIASKVKTLAAIGESGEKIASMCRDRGMRDIKYFGKNFEGAVQYAFESVKASGGGCVLLSPACASFDMFNSAEHRGDEFKKIVAKMESEN